MTPLTSHNRAFKAEWQKLRHSGIFWLCFGAAIFIPLLSTIIHFSLPIDEMMPKNDRWNSWISNMFAGFTGFFYPLFLVLTMVRLVYLEHRSDTWKLLETQPVSRLALYLAKWEVANLISFLCLLAFFLFALGGGLIIQALHKTAAFNQYSIDWAIHLKAILRYWISGMALLSLQYFLGLIVKSFAWPMGMGIMGVIMGSIFKGIGILPWWPYSFPALTTQSYNGSMRGNFLMHHEVMSLLWSALLLWVGYQMFVKKSFVRSFIFPARKAILTGALLIAFIALSWLVNKPYTLPAYSHTVIAGNVRSDKPIKTISLLRGPDYDTVAIIPVASSGDFHLRITDSLSQGIYYLSAAGKGASIFFGKNDSAFVKWSMGKQQNDLKISGNRVAENEFLSTNQANFWMLKNMAYDFNSKAYGHEALKTKAELTKEVTNYKTADNIRPRQDFIDLQKRLLEAQVLHYTDNYYPPIHHIYYPNQELKYPKGIDKLRKEINLNNNALAPYKEYRDYVKASLQNKAGNNDSVLLAAIVDEVQAPQLRDWLLYEVVQNNVLRIRDSLRRHQLFTYASSHLQDKSITQNLQNDYTRQLKLQRGQKAHNFSSLGMNGKSYSLKDLSQRFVVIDVWATWCGPCKKETPYFEELAERYTSEGILFVGLSVDENKNDWRMETAGSKSKSLQLWLNDEEGKFAKQFAVSSIPRFILIDPRGNIVNADMPRPSEPEFEKILQKEIPALANLVY